MSKPFSFAKVGSMNIPVAPESSGAVPAQIIPVRGDWSFTLTSVAHLGSSERRQIEGGGWSAGLSLVVMLSDSSLSSSEKSISFPISYVQFWRGENLLVEQDVSFTADCRENTAELILRASGCLLLAEIASAAPHR
jgi:hypothetical protein